MNWIVALAAIVAAADLPQRLRLLRSSSASERLVMAGALVAAAVACAAVAGPLLDALDVSAPTLEVGAGMVLVLWSVVAFFCWTDDETPPAVAGGLVPGFFPVLFTPPVGVLLVATGARNGFPVPIVGALVVAAAVAGGPAVEGVLGRRPARRVSATSGVVLGIVLMTDGVLAV